MYARCQRRIVGDGRRERERQAKEREREDLLLCAALPAPFDSLKGVAGAELVDHPAMPPLGPTFPRDVLPLTGQRCVEALLAGELAVAADPYGGAWQIMLACCAGKWGVGVVDDLLRRCRGWRK